MKVGVVGSRNYPHEFLVRRLIQRLAEKDPSTIIVSGGARGVDRWAADEARRCGLQVEEHMADWEKEGRRAGVLRNATIVARSEVIVVFWDGVSKGTKDTIDRARAFGKTVHVVGV